jgi:hypothetical protein
MQSYKYLGSQNSNQYCIKKKHQPFELVLVQRYYLWSGSVEMSGNEPESSSVKNG